MLSYRSLDCQGAAPLLSHTHQSNVCSPLSSSAFRYAPFLCFDADIDIPFCSHWQLRSLVGVSSSNTVYYPAGKDNQHIQEFDPATNRSETIAYLTFSPRCLVAAHGWICCGGEEGEFVVIRHTTGRGRSSNAGSGNDGGSGDRSEEPTINDEEYDDFDLRLGGLSPSLVAVPPRMSARSYRCGKERVNCVTIWAPPTIMPSYVGSYRGPVAVLANNDKHVTVIDLGTAENLDELGYPDCVNRAVLSPDGRLLAAVSDDPFLYIHERVEKIDPASARYRHLRSDAQAGNEKKEYEWKLLAKHHLRGQSKHDKTVHRGSFAACFSNTGKYLAIGTQYGVISIFDTDTLDEGGTGLVACFSSSAPNSDSGAVREMTFCSGAFDLLAWSEDHGAVGVADIRNGFVSRQILKLCDTSAYEHVAINHVIHTNDDFFEEHTRQRRRQSTGADEAMRDVLAGTRLLAEDDDSSIDAQAQRVRDAFGRYNMPLTADETQFMEALQERRRRRERDQREQQGSAVSFREQRERDRERIQEYLGRRSEWLLRARPSLGSRTGSDSGTGLGSGGASSSNNNNNTSSGNGSAGNNGGGGTGVSSASLRAREREASLSVAVNDILGSLRTIRSGRDAAEHDRRWLAPTPLGLIQAARRNRAGAIPTVENEESGSDDDGFSSRTLTQSSRRRSAWPGINPSPFAYGGNGSGGTGDGGDEEGGGTGGGSSRTLDLLHAYTLGEQVAGRSGGGGGVTSTSRRDQPPTLTTSMLNRSGTYADWQTGSGIGDAPVRRAREPGPSEEKDGHTAGLAWSEDGQLL